MMKKAWRKAAIVSLIAAWVTVAFVLVFVARIVWLQFSPLWLIIVLTVAFVFMDRWVKRRRLRMLLKVALGVVALGVIVGFA